jgi:hypothetical protein
MCEFEMVELFKEYNTRNLTFFTSRDVLMSKGNSCQKIIIILLFLSRYYFMLQKEQIRPILHTFYGLLYIYSRTTGIQKA